MLILSIVNNGIHMDIIILPGSISLVSKILVISVYRRINLTTICMHIFHLDSPPFSKHPVTIDIGRHQNWTCWVSTIEYLIPVVFTPDWVLFGRGAGTHANLSSKPIYQQIQFRLTKRGCQLRQPHGLCAMLYLSISPRCIWFSLESLEGTDSWK